jgi:hypothetical protein
LFFLSCHTEEEADSSIKEIKLSIVNNVLMVGQEVSVITDVKPDEAKYSESISYSMSAEGYVELKNGTNNGVVIKALQPGNVVLIAKSSKSTAYLEIKIDGGDFVAEPYILVANPVVELKEGEQKTLNVTLYGGSVLDNPVFEWYLDGQAGIEDRINILTTGNNVVIKGLKAGNQKIKIRHPKARFETELLVFVNKSNEFVKYIYCEKNVVLLATEENYKTIALSLYGGTNEDKKDFRYEVIEGKQCIDIIPNNEIINVKALLPGTAVIKVTHPYAEMPFEIRIITVTGNIPLITLSNTFVILELGRNTSIKADLENPKTVTALNEFHFSYDGNANQVVDVTQINNEFFIVGKANGLAKIIVRNDQADYSRECLVFVRSDVVYRDDYYITTSQNVIQTQVGDPDIQLTMLLVNGNYADANGFEWNVSDGTVIKVESGHAKRDAAGNIIGIYGNVNEPDSAWRANVINDVFVATAVITPKRSGTSTITISHPKSESAATVLVKVYPRNTFQGSPIIVKFKNYIDPDGNGKVDGGLIRIIRGKDMAVTLDMISGSDSDIGSVNWSVNNDPTVAHVPDNVHGMTNILSGYTSDTTGRTKLRVEGGNLRQAHEAIVLVGTQAELDAAKIIYVDSIYQTIATQQVIRLQVKNSQNASDLTGYKVTVNSEGQNKLYAVMVKSELVLQGKEPGEAVVHVTHPDGQADGIDIFVTVQPANLTIEKPYYFTGPEIIGVSLQGNKNIEVNLVGAHESKYSSIKWDVENSSVINATAKTGKTNILTAKVPVNNQTNIIVSHPQSESKSILVYTANTEEELNSKVVLGVNQKNYLLVKGESVLITVKTNAQDRENIDWAATNYGVTILEPHGDSCDIRTVGTGNSKITISHHNQIKEAEVFISVVDARYDDKLIQGPATIELIRGESQIVYLNTRNLSDIEKGNIKWSIEDGTIATIQENGDSAYLLGIKKGVSFVNIVQSGLNFKQRATLLCANTREELASMYIMGAASSYYSMNLGEERKINLEFGSNGFPEVEKTKIEWKASESGVVRLSGADLSTGTSRGEKMTVIASAEGTGYVDVTSPVSENSLRLTFDVMPRSVVNKNLEFKNFDRVKGIVMGNKDRSEPALITVKIFDGNEDVTNKYMDIKVTPVNNDIIEVDQAGNILNIWAKTLPAGTNTATSVINVSHSSVKEDARILVYTARTQTLLNNMYPITAEKKNYLLQVGESAEVNLITDTAKDNPKMNDITWGISNGNVVTNFQVIGKKKATFKADRIGTTELLIGYPDSSTVVEKVFVSVVDRASIDFSKRIMTENIIGLVKGEQKNTAVMAVNFSDSEKNDLFWESTNPSVVQVVSFSKEGAVIKASPTAGNNDECYITISYGSWLKRHILVYVCDDAPQVKAYKAMNIENQYIRMGKNDSVIVPVYFAPNKSNLATNWTDRYGNGVVGFEKKENGSKIEITSISEGVAILEAKNSGNTNPESSIRLYVEVSNDYVNIPRVDEQLKYLTTAQTVYLLNPDQNTVATEVTVTALGMTEAEKKNIKWQKSNDLITLLPQSDGVTCKILPNGKEGETMITVSHPAGNTLDIKVIVSRDAQLSGVVHIGFDDIVKVGFGETKNMQVNLQGKVSYNPANFTVTGDGSDKAEFSIIGSTITIKGKKPGQAKLTIDHPDSFIRKEVVVVVTTNAEGLIYMTTKDNFSVINENDFRTVSIEMMGYDDVNPNNYLWTVEPESAGILSVAGNGKTGVISALKGSVGKTGKIRVHNYNAEFDLFLYARVSDTEKKPVYITTAQNIVTITEGFSLNVEVGLVNGVPGEESLFEWFNQTPDFITFYAAGKTALIKGTRPGAGRVQIRHPSSLNGIEIVVIVEPDRSDSGIYITTSELLVDMKPNQPVKMISVNLVGGLPEDVYGFKWEILNYTSLEYYMQNGVMVNKPVIDLTSGADRAYINPLNEGEAIIRVTHPKTSYKLDIKIDVKLYNKIEFTTKNATVDMGDTLLLTVNAPTNQRVIYESSNENVALVSGTNKVCIVEGVKGPKESYALITARNVNGTLSDELLLKVNYKEVNDAGFIAVGGNLITLNKNDGAVLVKAKLEGNDKDGKPLTEKDWEDIEWHKVGDTNNAISLLPAYGSEVSIKPINAGEVELQLKHPKLKAGYIKRVYVRVTVDETIFNVNPVLVRLNPGGHETVECNLSNVLGSQADIYKDVVWENMNPELFTITPFDDNKKCAIDANMGALGQGLVEANYMGTKKRINVFIQPIKDIYITNLVELLVNQEMTINFTVAPETEAVYMTRDHWELTTVTYDDSYTGGAERSITIKANNDKLVGTSVFEFQTGSEPRVTRRLQVNVHDRKKFIWKDLSMVKVLGPYEEEINGQIVNKKRRIYFDVLPPDADVEIENVGNIMQYVGFEFNGRHRPLKSVPRLGSDENGRYVEIEVHGDGSALIALVNNDDDDPSTKRIEKRISCYYEIIELEFEIYKIQNSNGNEVQLTNDPYIFKQNKMYSEIDTSKNVLKLADGEVLYIRPKVDNVKYKGNNLLMGNLTENKINIGGQDGNYKFETGRVSLITDQSAKGGFSYGNSDDVIILFDPYHYKSSANSDYLRETGYGGLFTFEYKYHNGRVDGKMSVFQKSFVIYVEKWNRVLQN